MIAYLDTSLVIAWVLNEDERCRLTEAHEQRGSSELMLIEGFRVLDRMRLRRELDDATLALAKGRFLALFNGLSLLPLDDQVKRRAAASFPTVIGTLDAIHLASAELWSQGTGEDVAVFSLDRQMNTCAKAMGLATPLG